MRFQFKRMNILKDLLWKGKYEWQVIGAAIGAIAGLFLLLSALQLYFDLQQLINGNRNTDQYVLINKKVNLLNTLGARSNFTEEEIANLEAQEFIDKVGVFIPNQYKVSASSQLFGFYTELFFESIDDEFIDINNGRWEWEPIDNELPIILSRDYLALYNFGFAPSQGLPQFTPSTISKVTLDINLSGNGLRKTFQGRIIGFSDRINSILVPKSFMVWANDKFGETSKPLSSRVIIKTMNPYAVELEHYLNEKKYEVSSGRLIGGQLTTLLKNVITIIAIIGFIMVLLSFLIFMLNFQLIISRSKEDISLLLQLGYKTQTISGVLIKFLLRLFGIVLLFTFISLFISRYFFQLWFENQGFDLSGFLHPWVFLAALVFSLAFVTINTRSIKKHVSRLY